MNIFNKVTLQILKKNKTRTIVTIIGIILSTSMFTAVTASVSSLQNYMVENTIYRTGDWHANATETDEKVFAYLESAKQVESYVYNQKIGYAIAKGCTNEDKPYIYLIGADKEFMENMPVHLTGGRYPENETEILLPDHLAENGDVRYKVGDVLELGIGERISDGDILGQKNPYLGEEEYLEVTETKIYTVVGFYERPGFENYSAPGYTAITFLNEKQGEGALYDVYFKMVNPQDVMNFTENMWRELGCDTESNTDVLTYMGVSKYIGFHTVLYGLAEILMGLIMFGSISLIYNAFSISVSERTRQFGLLSSIGATKKQLRKMVFFEALVVSAIGIPLGILAGIGGMGVTFFFIGKIFNSITDYAIPLTLHIEPWTVIAACVITLVTVLISAWLPSKRATTVTAVEAIRQSADVKTRRKEPKTSRFIYRLFGLPGMIADKYYKRSKKKYRATVISLFMSIVLFVSASAFTSYLTDTVEASFSGENYDITYLYDPAEYADEADILSQAELSCLFKEADGVTLTTYVNSYIQHVSMENQYISEAYLAYREELNEMLDIDHVEGYTAVYLSTLFVDDVAYEAFLEEQHLDKNLYMNEEEPLGIAFDGKTEFDYDLEKYVTSNILKSKNAEIVLGNEETSTVLKVNEVFYERPYFVSERYDLAVIYPYSMKEAVLQGVEAKTSGCYHYILSEDSTTSFSEMKNILVENGLSKSGLYNHSEAREESRSLILVINVFSYGFIVLISLIAAANVFNTVSTNISLRRREFAMLKSVGMSNRELKSMMNFECVLYGSRALLYGLPVSAVITWLIYRVISEGYTAGFYLPWGAIGIAVLSVFAVVFATMMYSMRKIKKDNPIDELKNENL